MNLSGILVYVSPAQADTTAAAIDELPGVEVYARDSAGHIIVVQEAVGIDEEVAGLRRLKSLPNVITAELVYHYFAEDPTVAPFPSPDPGCQTGSQTCIPAALNE